MSEERILQNKPGTRLFITEKPKYKDLTYIGEQDSGSFLLTSRRILFLRKSSMTRTLGAAALELAGAAGLLVGLPAALVLGESVSNRISSVRIKSEEVDKLVQADPNSIEIPLESIISAPCSFSHS